MRYGEAKHLKLNSTFDLFLIICLGALIPAFISALLGPVSLLASGLINSDMLAAIIWRWWRGDVLGIAFLTPLILSFVRHASFSLARIRFWETLVLWVLAIAMGQMVFLAWSPFTLLDKPLDLIWIFPLIIWVGLRTGRRNTALIQLLFMGQALASAHLKIGVFATDFTQYGLSNFWMFAMVLATSGMALAIMATAQRHAARTIAQNAWVFELSHDGVIITDVDNKIFSVNAAFTDITGYTLDEVLGKDPRILSSGRHELEFFKEMWDTLNETRYWSGEVWNRRKDGSV
jgi:PAS domain-containing protein